MQANMIVDGLKRELKSNGITYADLASRIGMSEASVKRMFAQKNFTLQRLDEILKVTSISLSEITRFEGSESKLISALTIEQETQLISDPKLFMIAVSVLNMLRIEQITQTYAIEPAEAVKYLLRLDKLGFISLLPNNRVKLLVSRTFSWQPNGPIQNYFKSMASEDYLNVAFDGKDELMQLTNLVLSPTSVNSLVTRLQQVAREFSQIHQDEMKIAYADKTAISLLIATRHWQPQSFKALLRKPKT